MTAARATGPFTEFVRQQVLDLYHLPRECPVGYDPRGTRTE
ncbi:MAG: hypothetical protein ABW292_14150 [Vicinamibacterales bacterium]